MKVAVYTLGCKVNQYESQVLMGEFKKAGMEVVPFSERADAYVINTCSVTAESDRKSRQIINRAVSKNPAALICVTGCYSQLKAEQVAAIPGVDIVTGTKDRLSIVNLILKHAGEKTKISTVRDPFSVKAFEPMSIDNAYERTRISIKIQDGCDNFCSYCVIPYARGPVLSKPFEDIRAEVAKIVSAGYKEIVLTGIHISSYGKDMGFKRTLSDVLALCEEQDGEFRVRLGSLNLSCFTDEFLRSLSSFKKLCPHFHISLQSGCDKTLKAMNRKYTASEFKEVLEKIRTVLPNAAITTDVIVGFPGETEEDFLESLKFVEESEFLKVHVFPYSSRPGTAAEKLGGHLSRSEKSARAHKMSETANKVADKFLNSQIGLISEVLIEEKTGENTYRGYTKNYCITSVKSPKDILHETVLVRIIDKSGDSLCGEYVENV